MYDRYFVGEDAGKPAVLDVEVFVDEYPATVCVCVDSVIASRIATALNRRGQFKNMLDELHGAIFSGGSDRQVIDRIIELVVRERCNVIA